jgi:PAS domain S-box-containing protein
MSILNVKNRKEERAGMFFAIKDFVKKLFVLLILIFLILGGINVYYKISQRDLWDGSIWGQKGGKVYAVRSSKFNEIRKDDVLISINDKPVKKISDYQRLTELAKEGEVYRYQIQRKGEIETINVQFKEKDFPYKYIFFSVFGVFSLLYLLFFFSKGLFKEEALITHFSILVFLISSTFLFSPTNSFTIIDNIFFWIDKISLILFPPVLLHFILIFPENLLRRKKIIKLFTIYTPSILLILAYLYSYFFPYKVFNILYSLFYLLKRLEILFLSFYLILAFVILILKQNKLKDPATKNQSRIILTGISLSLPFSFLYGIPFVLGYNPSQLQEFLSFLLILIPITIAHAITKWKVEDLGLYTRKFLSHLLTLSPLLIILYLLSLKFSILSLSGLVIIFLMGILYNPLRNLIYRKILSPRAKVRAIPFEGKFYLLLRSLSELHETIKNIFEKSLKIDRIYLFLSLRDGRFGLVEEDSIKDSPISKNFQKILEKKKLVQIELIEKEKLATEDDIKELERLKISSVLPLFVGERVVGWVGIGKKEGWKALNRDDLKFVESIAPFVSLATENAQLWEELRKRAEEMERMKEYNEEIIENLKVGVVVVDEEERVKSWNSTAETLFNLARNRAIGKHLREVLDPSIYSQLFTTPSKEYYPFQSRIVVNLNSERKIYEVLRSSLLTRNNEYLGTIFIFEDITDRLTIENQLMISEKLASLGLLTAGIAHEINTPLTGISSYVQLLLKSSSNSADREIAEKIEAQIERVGKMVRSLLSFSRGEKGQIKKFPLKNCINDILTLLDYKIKKQSINSQIKIPDDIEVWGELDKLQQVFLNIISNAIDAMPEGGTLKVEAERKENNIMIIISDTGTGIKKEHLTRIFEPFFTTKGYGSGTGLGLSISYQIVKEHNGDITVESEYGKGTTFKIILPANFSDIAHKIYNKK